MTVREGGPPGGLLRWLLFDDINHPRYAKFIGDFAKAMRPERFLPGQFDFSVSCVRSGKNHGNSLIVAGSEGMKEIKLK